MRIAAGRVGLGQARGGGPDWRQQDVQQPLLGVLRRLLADLFEPVIPHHVDGELDEVADHRFDVASHVADLSELGCLDLYEGRLCEPRQPPRDLGLPHAGRADHEDVLRSDLFGQFGGELLPPHPVAKRDGDRALGSGLTDHVLVQLGDNLTGRERLG